MSRFTQRNSDYEMAYGYDHACGLFIQIFERKNSMEDDEGIVVNLDEFSNKLTPEKMVSIAEDHGFHIELPEKIIH